MQRGRLSTGVQKSSALPGLVDFYCPIKMYTQGSEGMH